MKDFLAKYKNVRKLIASVLAGVAIIAAPHTDLVSEGALFGIDIDTLVQGALLLLGAIGVYQVPNGEVEEA